MSRDSQLTEIKKSADSVQKENYQQEQIQDRLRHYEAQAQLVETLQRELSASQVTFGLHSRLFLLNIKQKEFKKKQILNIFICKIIVKQNLIHIFDF